MNHRPHPAFALALATALTGAGVGTASLPAGADDPEEPVVERCFTEALTVEEVEEGATSVIDCVEVTEDEQSRLLSIDLAIVYDAPGLGGATSIFVTGSSCTGAVVNFAPAAYWNNRISSTDLLACGNAKHWSDPGLTGNNQLMTAGGGPDLVGVMNNATTSIAYAP